MKLILPILLIIFGLGGATPHKFEDGFVERTLAIVVRDNLATAEYSLGLNETTIEALLTQWTSDSKGSPQTQPTLPNNSESTSAQSGSADGPESPVQKIRNTANRTSDSKPIVLKSTTRIPSPPSEPSTDQAVSQSKPSTTEPSISAENDSEEEDVISPEVFDEFKVAVANQLTKRLQIKVGEEDLKVTNVSVERAPRHPFSLVVKFQFEIPPAETSELRIVDNNFSDQHGAVRYSLKALGSTILLKSNVAPIIVRSKRVELKGLSRKETAEQTSISVRLAGVPTTKTDNPNP